MIDQWRLVAATTLLAITSSALSHHAMDLTDATSIRIEGAVEFVSWDGAHVVYDIRGRDIDGELRTWAVMGASPRILRSRGIGKATFKVGDHITVTGRFDRHTQFIAPEYFITADSTRYEMGLYPPRMVK